MPELQLTSIDLAARSGGMASGLEIAGFTPILLAERDPDAIATLRLNRPDWPLVVPDASSSDLAAFDHVDLLTATSDFLPSNGASDDPFARVMEAVAVLRPNAVLVDAPEELGSPRFLAYRSAVERKLASLGYSAEWRQLDLTDFAIPQQKRVYVLLALDADTHEAFEWPAAMRATTVGRVLHPLMASRLWPGALVWASKAIGAAPAIGMHTAGEGEPMLSSDEDEWAAFGIEVDGIADTAPSAEDPTWLRPRLTNPMIARLQGSRAEWQFAGTPASVFRQMLIDFPAQVAAPLGRAIADAIPARNVLRPAFSSNVATLRSVNE